MKIRKFDVHSVVPWWRPMFSLCVFAALGLSTAACAINDDDVIDDADDGSVAIGTSANELFRRSGLIKIVFIDRGEPVAGERLLFSGPDGEVREIVETNEDGLAFHRADSTVAVTLKFDTSYSTILYTVDGVKPGDVVRLGDQRPAHYVDGPTFDVDIPEHTGEGRLYAYNMNGGCLGGYFGGNFFRDPGVQTADISCVNDDSFRLVAEAERVSGERDNRHEIGGYSTITLPSEMPENAAPAVLPEWKSNFSRLPLRLVPPAPSYSLSIKLRQVLPIRLNGNRISLRVTIDEPTVIEDSLPYVRRQDDPDLPAGPVILDSSLSWVFPRSDNGDVLRSGQGKIRKRGFAGFVDQIDATQEGLGEILSVNADIQDGRITGTFVIEPPANAPRQDVDGYRWQFTLMNAERSRISWIVNGGEDTEGEYTTPTLPAEFGVSIDGYEPSFILAEAWEKSFVFTDRQRRQKYHQLYFNLADNMPFPGWKERTTLGFTSY